MAKDVRRALMIASEPLKVPSTYAAMDPDARAAWKSDQMAREGHGSFSPPGAPEREENFNRWHGNSKIRDGEGNPLRLYHATPKSFDTFLPGGPNPANEMPSGPATWLSPYPDKQPAGHHVGGFEDKFKSGANVMPVHADIRNPLVIDNKTMRDWARQSYAKGSGEFPLLISPESRKMLLEDGYDGILWAGFKATSQDDEGFYDNHGIGEHPSKDEEIIALHPPGRAQIKSAIGNRGQYDPEDTHINYARGGDVDTKRALMTAKDVAANRARFLEGSKAPPVLYHGTHADIPSFKKKRNAHLGFHFGDVEAANNRLEDTADRAPWDKADLAERAKNSDGLFDKWKQTQDAFRRKNTEVPMQELVDALENNQDTGALFKKYEYVPTPEEAANAARLEQDYKKSQMPISKFGEGANIGKYHVAIKKPLRMPDVKNWGSLKEIKKHLPFGTEARTHGELIEDLRARGYDGIVYQNAVENPVMRTDSYIAFDPKQIKSATGNRGTYDPNEADVDKAAGGSATKRALMIARDQRALLRRIANIYPGPGGGMDPSPGGGGYSGPGGGKYIGPSHYADGGSVPPFKLHSGAAKIIKSKGQAKATPQQYAAMQGIKPDELKHSKFDTLGSKALPREEVIKHLEDNRLPIEETQLGGEGRNTATKFHDPKYQLPGGENYREVLLHLPGGETVRRSRIDAINDESLALLNGRSVNQLSPEEMAKWEALSSKHDAVADATSDFTGPHWEEPDVLAHLRLTNRVGPNGEKILHLEEAQSDWGQQGREKGFSNPEVANRQRELFQKLNDIKKAHVEAQRDVETKHKINLREFDAAYKDAMGGAESKFNASRMTKSDIDAYNEASDLALTKTQHLLDPAEKIRQEAHKQIHTAFAPKIEALEKEFSALPKHGDIPHGPYVDNTQKWTDLALKRVLHEAAHGGYDKIVVTPGDEQNKRYDLSSQVKNIQYYPDLGYLHATTHDDRGVEHEDVKPEDLSKHIGKEAADRILKQGMQRYEGRGKLGGEFYHELEGDGLKVGGEGMRGYYDNILPKRLQALAQQHDPQAKVRLGGYNAVGALSDEDVRDFHGIPEDEWDELRPEVVRGYREHTERLAPEKTTWLHSLDVTPQMRDSIKQGGFNSFKRGGEVGDDPIKDWQWRPTEDVRNELQLDEIPSHVHKFGEFMDETARKAMNEGFTPRDLIKAYTITRASIQRRARPVEAIRKSGLILPPDLKGVIRPEGAFGHWLHTKHGQRYLDEAEAGRVDEEAIADAQKIMKPYGKTKIDLPDALRWAPANLPGQEGRISELVTRAYRGHDHPDDWRDATSGLKGIGPAKKGFYGANLGYGKLPTLDAREITVHTGRPTKEATPYLRKKGAADAAVDRLANRQTELGLKHDKSMSPFYQHLAHHTVWDKASGEETTHDDLMHPMRNAKDGGRQGYKTGGAPPTIGHPLAHGLLEAFPEGFKDVPEEHLRQMLRNPFTDATEKEVRAALHTSPATHNLLYRASQLTGHPTQKLMQHLLPSGGPKEPGRTGITSLRQPDLIERAMATITPNWRIAVAKPRPMTPEDLFKMRAVSVAGMSDRSPAGFDVSGADKVDFGENISALGGNDFNLMPRSIKYGIGWAGARAPITGMGNAAREKLKEVKEKYGIDAQPLLTTKLMSLQSNDQTHMVMRAASHLLRNAPITDADAEAFNEYVRNQRPAAKQGVIQPPYMPDFPGIKHGKLYDYLMKQKMPNRTALIKAMDKGAWNKKGIPNPASIRMAFTKPELIVAPEGTPGAMFATMDPSNPHYTGDSGHGSYPVGATGKNVGGLDRIVPKEAFHQTYFDQPTVKAKVAAGKNARVMSGYIKSPVTQYHDQEWLDRIMPVYENAPPFRRAGGRAGYAPGGGVEQLQQNLRGAFSDLNRQVAAQGPQQQQAAPAPTYQAMNAQAAGQAPNDAYQRMMAQALNGKTYEEMFPTSPKVAAPVVAPVQLAAADAMPYYQTNYDIPSYGPQGGSGGDSGGSGDGLKRGGRATNIVERALAVTRRK